MVKMTKKKTVSSAKWFSLKQHWYILASLLSFCFMIGMIILVRIKEDNVMAKASALDLNSSHSIIRSGKSYLMYGTAWKKERTANLVSQAVKSGFRFIDTACQPKHYNEFGVGEGWTTAAKDIGLSRSDIFLQTKFTPITGQDPNNIPYDKGSTLEDQVKQSLKKSLTNLRTSYIDSLVLHSPLETDKDTMRVWRIFESFVDTGEVKQIGISNCYSLQRFTHIYEQARIKPSVLQNRFYSASGFDTELRKFCKSKNISYQSFWTLTGNREALADSYIIEMATRKGLTAQTLMYAFMLEQGHTPLSGSTNLQHVVEDVALMKRFHSGERLFTAEELDMMAVIIGAPLLD